MNGDQWPWRSAFGVLACGHEQQHLNTMVIVASHRPGGSDAGRQLANDDVSRGNERMK